MEPCAPIDGAFPNWRNVLPRGDSLRPTPAAWTAATLGRLVETAAIASSHREKFVAGCSMEDGGFTLRAHEGNPGNPHLVLYDTSLDVFSVAMPARYTWEADKLPYWLGV